VICCIETVCLSVSFRTLSEIAFATESQICGHAISAQINSRNRQGCISPRGRCIFSTGGATIIVNDNRVNALLCTQLCASVGESTAERGGVRGENALRRKDRTNDLRFPLFRNAELGLFSSASLSLSLFLSGRGPGKERICGPIIERDTLPRGRSERKVHGDS